MMLENSNDSLAKVLDRFRSRGCDSGQPDKSPILYLKNWPEYQRCAPNEILRSSLFSVIGKGKRVGIENKKIASWGEDSIYFSGLQLDQYDCDVWLQCLHLAREQKLGNKVFFSLREFLLALGKTGSGQNIMALKASFNRLHVASLRLDTRTKSYSGHLVNDIFEDKESGKWCLILNEKLQPLFASETTWINWELRKSLSGSLAKSLMAWVCSHTATVENPQRIGILKLKDTCGSATIDKKSFKQQLVKALKELQGKGILQSWQIENDILSLVRQ